MRVIDNIFFVKSVENGLYTLELNSHSSIYEAHFPSNPITPGVCMIQAVVELATKALEKPLDIKKIVNVKFTNVLSPLEYLEAQLELKISAVAEGEYSIKACYYKETTIFANISMIVNEY